jgi:uncharacterized protein YecE (DUF72 family)
VPGRRGEICRLVGFTSLGMSGYPGVEVSRASATRPEPAGGTLAVMELHVGCAMWTHAAWPAHRAPARERLAAYAGSLNAVEGNTSYYATPSVSTVQTWAEQVPPDFRFVMKLPKAVTHEHRLAPAGDTALRAFLAAMEPLGERAHMLWVQLPAAFGPGGVDALARFLGRLPREYRYCVEVRHPAFFTDPRAERDLENALSPSGAEWVPFDTAVLFESPPSSEAEREGQAKKPRMPRRTRALTGFPVVRYIGRDDPERTAEGWQPWADQAADWLREGRSPTVFIHTPDNARALELARKFHADVRARVPGTGPLPEPVAAGPPTLF